jgi:hypothetical protein
MTTAEHDQLTLGVSHPRGCRGCSMPPPDSWGIIARDLWLLPEGEARGLWRALVQSTRSRPRAMRQHFALAGWSHISDRFWSDFCTPGAVLACIGDLCAEHRLTRQRATKIEELLLRYVNRHGGWRGDAWDGTERLTTMPPDVIAFAETGKGKERI